MFTLFFLFHTVPTELKILYSEGTFQITEADHAVALTIGENVKTTGGRNLTIYCPTEGTPKPKVLWKYKDKMIGESDRHQNGRAKISKEDNSIFVPNVRPWDSGVYSCYAGNGFAVVSASSLLHILRRNHLFAIFDYSMTEMQFRFNLNA